MLVPALPYSRRPARELVCPDCSGRVVLLRGLLHCTGPNHVAEMRSSQAWGALADLKPGDRYRPCSSLPPWHRRTRECVRWEIATGRRMVGKGRAS